MSMGKNTRSQRKGKGSVWSSPSHRHKGEINHPKVGEAKGMVLDIQHDPGHTAPVAIVDFKGKKHSIIACSGMYVGQEIHIGDMVPVGLGNTMRIGNIPEGVEVYNIEGQPGDGGRFARSAGSYAVVVSQGKKTTIKMPSESFKSLSPHCLASIGAVAGAGRTDKPFAKAGKKWNCYRSRAKKSFKVRGIAMNAVNHPHGGGGHQHVGVPSTVAKKAPPGRKVGRLSPKKKRRK
jgi:large subunit ribosomal protein L2